MGVGSAECGSAAAQQTTPPDASAVGDANDATAASARRIKLTFRNAARAEALLDFPVLVALDATRIDYGAVQPGGGDLRFNDPDGTPLAFEIQTWNPAGRSAIWGRVPQ